MSTRTRADEAHDVAEAAVAHLSEIDERLTALPASTPAATRRKLEAEFDAQHAVVTRKVKEADRLYSIEENGRRTRAAETGGGYAVARNSLRSEGVYRPDGSASFFADLVSHRSNRTPSAACKRISASSATSPPALRGARSSSSRSISRPPGSAPRAQAVRSWTSCRG
jgi:hypothetical protein